MINVVLVGVGVVIAIAVSLVSRRRAPDAPTQGGFQLPTQVDRADFDGVDAPWLVLLFSSATCDACRDMLEKARVLEAKDVAVVDVEYSANKDLHKRYAIDAVPSLVVVDQEGVVRAGFMGPVKAQDLWAAVAECREPGSTPDHGLGHIPRD